MSSDPIALTVSQTFELERLNRAIDSSESLEELREMAKMLASCWMTQKASVNWIIRNQMSPPGKGLFQKLLDLEKE